MAANAVSVVGGSHSRRSCLPLSPREALLTSLSLSFLFCMTGGSEHREPVTQSGGGGAEGGRICPLAAPAVSGEARGSSKPPQPPVSSECTSWACRGQPHPPDLPSIQGPPRRGRQDCPGAPVPLAGSGLDSRERLGLELYKAGSFYFLSYSSSSCNCASVQCLYTSPSRTTRLPQQQDRANAVI